MQRMNPLDYLLRSSYNSPVKKRVYKKNKTVVFRKKIKKTSHLEQITNIIPYIIFATLFIGTVFYYIQFCLISTYNNISMPLFTPQQALADTGGHTDLILNTQLSPFEDELNHKTNIGNPQIIEHGPRDKKEVALTFDADMTGMMQYFVRATRGHSFAGSSTVGFLTRNNIKATIFMTGLWIETYPKETKALAANPIFELANHSYSHPSFAGSCFGLPRVSDSQYPSELEKTQELLLKYTNKKAKYFRFPGGCYDQGTLDLVKKEGMETVHWDSVAHDGFNQNTDQIIANVMNQTKNGSIIVMHLGGETNAPKTLDALRIIYSQLSEKGYTFVTVSELLSPDHTKQAVDLRKYLLLARVT